MPQKRILPVLIVIILSFLLISTDNWLQTTSVFGQASQIVTSRPAPRASDQMMTYDEGNRRVLLFGGKGQDTNYGDLWAWNGRGWMLLANSGPTPRNSGVLVYDSRRRRTVLIGGRTRQGNETVPLTDTWAWDGKTWQKLSAEGPPQRTDHRMAFDRRNGEIVLFGELKAGNPTQALDDMRAWDGQRWKEITTAGPAKRSGHVMAYDAARGKTRLYSGGSWDGKTSTNYSDLWEWDGKQWTDIK